MQPQETRDANNRASRPDRHEGMRELLRRPGVRALLILAAGGQFLAVHRGGTPVVEKVATMSLAPVVVTPSVAEVAKARAAESAEQLAARYRAEGFDVSDRLARDIQEAAQEHGIDPEIAFGLVRAESSFKNSSTSPVGAVGLTQLMPSTARWLEPGVTRSELRDPDTNLRIGFKYLRQLIDKYEGNESLALLAYNRGPGTVDRALKRGRNPDNGYADFVRGKKDHGHRLFTR